VVNQAGEKAPLSREEFMQKMNEIYGLYEVPAGGTGSLFNPTT
jgi:hypothetical protein